MLTTFSSSFSRYQPGYPSSTILVGSNADVYYCDYCDHDALTNADVHVTSAADSSLSTTCRNLNVFRIKGSGSCSNLSELGRVRYPYTGSVLLYVMKYSEGQKTSYTNQTIGIKNLPLYSNPADVVFHKHFFNNSFNPRRAFTDIRFDVRTNITIKPNQRLRCCMVCFHTGERLFRTLYLDLTTTVFYNGN